MSSVGIDDVYELSPLQQGMLYHTACSPASVAYNVQLDFALEGDLDVSGLKRSWAVVAARHAPLRTSFVWERVEKPYQVVRTSVPIVVTEHDLTGLERDEQAQRFQALLDDDRARPFDLSKAPLMRIALVATGPRSWRLVWSFHHMILEGWSASILLQELWQVYGDLRAGRSSSLPEPDGYVEYIRWLQKQDRSRAEAYWRETLQGISSPARLFIDRLGADDASEVTRVDSRTLRVAEPTTLGLKELARRHRVTLNTVIQGLWAIVLSRYSGESDVVFGTAVSGRPPELPNAERVVGLFVNVLPMRIKISPESKLGDWLRGLQLEQVTMREFEYSSLLDVKSWSDVSGGRPLFTSAVIFENWLGDLPDGDIAPGLRVAGLEIHETSDQPLTLFVVPGATLTLTLMYDVERFDGDDIERMLAHCSVLLESMLAEPDAELRGLQMLTAAERSLLLEEWNDTRTERRWDESLPSADRASSESGRSGVRVHDLVAAQARARPDAIAVSDETRQLTYSALEERAERLARRLRAEGVEPGDLVGICVERSVELVAGLLAILKAGAAYLPLDASHPKERLAYVLRDAAASVIVAEESTLPALPDEVRRMVLLDADERTSALPEAPLGDGRGAAPSSRAYVIYTSGSTGRPKGVQIPHSAVVNFLGAMRRRPGLEPDDVLLAVTTVSFDIHVLEVFLPLVTGARVHLVSREAASDGRRLLALLHESGASVMQATPTTWRMLIQAGWNQRLALKVLCGGEPLPQDLAGRLLERCDELWNLYGPTETTVWSSLFRVRDASGPIPVGRPIDNTRLYVLDAGMAPVPTGAVGELFIGGAGVADGYIERPELTAEKFLRDPFAREPGARLYRTGDLARWRPDGNVELLGRTDDQVKIRGFRIELGEIEKVLAEHSGVAAAAAAVRFDGEGGCVLAGYAVPKGTPPPSAEVHELLRARLPHYMVPAAIVWLDALPLTSSGKLDRKALPEPSRTVDRREDGAARPQGELEAVMARIWADVLEIDDIHASDGFFDLGGHSLLSLKVVERFERETGLAMTPLDLVNQTLRQVVAGVAAKNANAGSAAKRGARGGQRWRETLKLALSRSG